MQKMQKAIHGSPFLFGSMSTMANEHHGKALSLQAAGIATPVRMPQVQSPQLPLRFYDVDVVVSALWPRLDNSCATAETKAPSAILAMSYAVCAESSMFLIRVL